MTATSAPGDRPAGPGTRFASIDIIRGAVMVLMALDHARVYSGLPAGGPTPGIFFTRWVTHFCAPAFVFLAGTSAYFHAQKHPRVGRFLVTRGAWLVLLELTVIRLSWTFNFDYEHYLLAGVIWAIGWCMILLAILVRRPAWVVGAVGVVIIAGHNAFGSLLMGAPSDGPVGAFFKVLYVGFFQGPIPLWAGGPELTVLYSIIPWIGVMAAGFGFGAIMTMDAARRRRLCLGIGLGAIGLFLVLRGFNLYGDPEPWAGGVGMPAVLTFLNVFKYPASLLFLLMTLGPTIALIPLVEGARGGIASWLTGFGRVPMFYYLIHIPLIHLLALGISQIRLGEVSPWLLANHPMGNPEAPDGYTWGLPLLYGVWAGAVGLLYFPCRWFGELKARRKDWWLRYL